MSQNKGRGEEIAARVESALDAAVREKRIVGGVALVARDGILVARQAVGLADREAGVRMRGETPFLIASLTKPIVSVVVLGLVERGVLSLEDPVTRWLPEFAPTFEGRAVPITVRHLLTHTSGLGYAFLEPQGGPYHAANVSDGLDQPGLSLDENLRRLASLPLYFEPGTAFRYSLAFDVLGSIVARAAGASLPDLVARAVTGPLGMEATSFTPRDPAALATPYADGKPEPVRITDGMHVPYFGAGPIFAPSRALDPGSYPSGGAGLVGTAGDFLRFLEALRTRASFAPKRQIDAMLSDQIAPLSVPNVGEGWGFGYGVSYLRDPAPTGSPLNAGTVRWNGAYGHFWWIDPVARLSAVLLTNTTFEGMAGQIRGDLERAVYGV